MKEFNSHPFLSKIPLYVSFTAPQSSLLNVYCQFLIQESRVQDSFIEFTSQIIISAQELPRGPYPLISFNLDYSLFLRSIFYLLDIEHHNNHTIFSTKIIAYFINVSICERFNEVKSSIETTNKLEISTSNENSLFLSLNKVYSVSESIMNMRDPTFLPPAP